MMVLEFSKWFMEGMGAVEYKIPADARHKLYDFYLLGVLQGESLFHREINKRSAKPLSDDEKEILFEIKHAWDTLIPDLRTHILKVVGNSLLSEIRHYPDKDSIRYDDDYDDLKAAFHGRNTADAYGDDALKPLVEKMKKLFLDRRWPSSYGGKPWSYACTAWLKLYEAKTVSDQSVWIDHIYDLQHNTGSLLNKNSEYKGEWLHQALEAKKHAQGVDELLPGASGFVRKLARQVIYMREKRGQKDDFHDLFPKVSGPDHFHQDWPRYSRGEDREDRGRPYDFYHDQMTEHENYWSNRLNHTHIEWSAESDHDQFEWAAEMKVEVEAPGKWGKVTDNQLDGLVKELDDNNFPTKNDSPIEYKLASRHGNYATFTINVVPQGDSSGNPSEFYNVMDDVYKEWDRHYDTVAEIIKGYFMRNGVIDKSPARNYADSIRDKTPWQHLDWEHEHGTFKVTGSGDAGVSQYMHTIVGGGDKTVDHRFVTAVDTAVKRLITREIESINRGNEKQSYFAGFDRAKPEAHHDLKELNVWVDVARDERPGLAGTTGNVLPERRGSPGGQVMRLNVSMSIDDSSTEGQVAEFERLAHRVDRLFPHFVGETQRLVQQYDAQFLKFTRAAGEIPVPNRMPTGGYVNQPLISHFPFGHAEGNSKEQGVAVVPGKRS